MRHALLGLLLLATPVAAQQPMTGAEFERYTEGRTLTFELQGTPYGIEEYLPGRRVVWSFLDGECKDGTWYEQPPYICFQYDDGTGPQCWEFFQQEGGLSARFAGDPEGAELYETREASEPMMCLGPDVGV